MNESQHQRAVITWARLMQGTMPELKYLYAIPNGGYQATARSVARLKAEGLKPGVSDLHLPVPRKGYHGLWIEMKAEKGKLSDEQKHWLDSMVFLGHAAYVCRSWAEARDLITLYLKK